MVIKIFLSLATLFILTFSSFTYGGWIEITKSSSSGNTIYIDLDRVEKINDYIYYYSLTDYREPVFGDLSVIVYHEADCELSRERGLNWVFFRGQMAQGKSITENNSDKEWAYPLSFSSSSSRGIALKKVCENIFKQSQ